MSFDPILLAPKEYSEQIYSYRRVWRTSWLEIGVLWSAVILIFVLTDLFEILPADLHTPLPKVGIALLPLVAWLIISYRNEHRVPQPRPGLLGVLMLGVLVASGIAVPLDEHVFLTERWLPTSSFFGRVLGYMCTLGFTAEFLKYAVLRYTIWPGCIHRRMDGIAYAITVSLGYAIVFNLRVALLTDVTLLATALRVTSITFSQLAVGSVMGFFLAELVIGNMPIFWLPTGLSIAALLSGLYYAFRGVTLVGGLSVVGTGAAPLRGGLLALGLIVVMFLSLAFIINNADSRMETLSGPEPTL